MKIVLFNTYIFDNNFIFNIINFCSSLINISNLLIFGLISILSLKFTLNRYCIFKSTTNGKFFSK